MLDIEREKMAACVCYALIDSPTNYRNNVHLIAPNGFATNNQ